MRFLGFLMAFVLIFDLAYASARVIIPLKKELRLSAETDFQRADYSWVLLSEEGYILDNQNGTNYIQKFSKEGNYQLNLTVTDKETGESKYTETEIIVGNPNKFYTIFSPKIEVLPGLDSDGEISFRSTGASVDFFLASSVGVKEFYLDDDLSFDSDEDGDPTNDKDNKLCQKISDCPNYNLKVQKRNSNKREIKFTFIGFGGQEQQETFTLAFNKRLISKENKLKAVLSSLPTFDEETKEIFVPYGVSEVLLFSKFSHGDFLDYRIDTDIDVDSDGDGKTGNDIDNKSHPSLKNGSAFTLKRGEKESQVVQLLVVSGDKGSLIRKKVVWGKENTKSNLSLFLDKKEIFEGEEIYFGVSDFLEGEHLLEWDFDGDGKLDEKNKQYLSKKYKKAGVYTVVAKVSDKETGKILSQSSVEITVSERGENGIKVDKPFVDFSFKVNGPIVNFKESVQVDKRLLDSDYSVFWKFGNGKISTDQSPEFIYSSLGDFEVELIATDSVGNKSSVLKTISIKKLSLQEELSEEVFQEEKFEEEEILDLIPEEVETPLEKEEVSQDQTSDSNSSNSGFGEVFYKIFIYFLFFILVIFGLFFLYLFFQKIKNPDYTFGEILEEEREKFLSMIEGEPYLPHEEELKIEEEEKEEVPELEIVENVEEKIPEKEEEKTEENPPDLLKEEKKEDSLKEAFDKESEKKQSETKKEELLQPEKKSPVKNSTEPAASPVKKEEFFKKETKEEKEPVLKTKPKEKPAQAISAEKNPEKEKPLEQNGKNQNQKLEPQKAFEKKAEAFSSEFKKESQLKKSPPEKGQTENKEKFFDKKKDFGKNQNQKTNSEKNTNQAQTSLATPKTSNSQEKQVQKPAESKEQKNSFLPPPPPPPVKKEDSKKEEEVKVPDWLK